MRVGVIAIQGAVSEHVDALRRAIDAMGIDCIVEEVRRGHQLDAIHGVVLPGGESTTIGKLMERHGVTDRLVRLGEDGLPIMGTCAGMIMMAREGDDEVERTGTRLLGLMDMAVTRNAFGRQRESFEAMVEVQGMDGGPFQAVFIRAPAVTRCWGACGKMVVHDGRTVGVRQDNLLALAFHPELTDDIRAHGMFLSSL